MNNRPPISSSSASSVINSYRKRQQKRGPNIVYIIAGVLVLGGLALLIYWLATTENNPISNMLATDTPTPTMTYTPTNTSTPTETPTVTATFTVTPTATFSTPFNYTVEAGDYLSSIVDKFGLGDDGIELIFLLNPYDEEAGTGIDPANPNIIPGQIILLPNPGMQLPTATPIPPNLPRGTKVDYTVKAGDSLAAIAAKFNSTEEEIAKENSIEDPNALFVGQQLVIPVNIVTVTPTLPFTSTPGPNDATATLTPINFVPEASETPSPTNTAAP